MGNYFCIFQYEDVTLSLNDNEEFLRIRNAKLMSCRNHDGTTRRLVKRLIQLNVIDSSKNILDSGCYIGDNSLPWACSISGTVYAIDPAPDNCKYIKAISELNSLDNLVVIEKALSGSEGEIATNDDLSSFRNSSFGKTGKIKLQSTTLDSLLKAGIIDNLGLLHLDVEGMEEVVIRSGRSVIEKFKPTIIFEQHLFQDNYIEISKFLEQYGYDVYIISGDIQTNRIDCRNLLAVHSNQDFSSFQNDIKSGALKKIHTIRGYPWWRYLAKPTLSLYQLLPASLRSQAFGKIHRFARKFLPF